MHLSPDLLDYMDFFKSRGFGVINSSAVGMGLLSGGELPPWHPAPTFIKEACKKAAMICKESNLNIGKSYILLVWWQQCGM